MIFVLFIVRLLPVVLLCREMTTAAIHEMRDALHLRHLRQMRSAITEASKTNPGEMLDKNLLLQFAQQALVLAQSSRPGANLSNLQQFIETANKYNFVISCRAGKIINYNIYF